MSHFKVLGQSLLCDGQATVGGAILYADRPCFKENLLAVLFLGVQYIREKLPSGKMAFTGIQYVCCLQMFIR